MKGNLGTSWLPPVDLSRPPPGPPPGSTPSRPHPPYSSDFDENGRPTDFAVDVPPPGWNRLQYDQEYRSSVPLPTDFSRPPPSNLSRTPPPSRLPPPPPPASSAIDDAVTNPYAQPRSIDALRQRALATRLEWSQNPDLQNKFSDSEFSDNSVASTDGFVRTTGFRYGNAAARGRKLEAMNAAMNGGGNRDVGDCNGIYYKNGGNNDRHNNAYDHRHTNRQNESANDNDVKAVNERGNNGAPRLSRGRGRGLRSDDCPTNPGPNERGDGYVQQPRLSNRGGDYDESESEELSDDSDGNERRAGNDSRCLEELRKRDSTDAWRSTGRDYDKDDFNYRGQSRSNGDQLGLNQLPLSSQPPSVSYSLNTDIRNAQDVTQRHAGAAFLHDDVASDAALAGGYHKGRRYVAAAHKRYTVVGESSSAKKVGKRRAALDSLIVQLTSKAKRRDERGREYYIRDEIMPFDEDQRHEFKGHRSMAYDEQPLRSRASAANHRRSSRKPVSLALNAFLNSECGGTIYLGVLDTGGIKGLMLTPYQKDHVRLQVEDLFSRYQPTVASHRFHLSFVPVLEGIDLESEIATLDSYENETRLDTLANKKHRFRTPHYCWCDKDAVALLEFGRIPSQYIIEIEIFPWNPEDPRNPSPFGPDCPNIAPIHEDEMGRVSFRRNASNYCPLVSEILEYAKHQVDKFYLDLIDELDLVEDDGENEDENVGGSIFDETRKDGMKSRLGLNVMEKTIKSMKRCGTWERRREREEDDGGDAVHEEVTRDLMAVDGSSSILADTSDHVVDCDLPSEVDKLLRIGDDSYSPDLLAPLE